LLGNGVSYVAEYDSEIGVDASTYFFHKDILGVGCCDWLNWFGGLVGLRNRTALSVELLGLLRLVLLRGRHDALSIVLIFCIVGEKIVLLSVNHSVNYLTCVVALFAENLSNDFHNDRSQGWESHKDALYNAAGKLF